MQCTIYTTTCVIFYSLTLFNFFSSYEIEFPMDSNNSIEQIDKIFPSNKSDGIVHAIGCYLNGDII